MKFHSIQLTKICHCTKIRTKYLGWGGGQISIWKYGSLHNYRLCKRLTQLDELSVYYLLL